MGRRGPPEPEAGAQDMSRGQRALLAILTSAGSVLVGLFLFHLGRALGAVAVFPLAHLLWALAAAVLLVQTCGVWYLYWNWAASLPGPAPRGLSVDVYITVYNEDLQLVERALRAARSLEYPHRTYLLDDGRDGSRRELAESLGAAYLTRPDNTHHKAGNINAALQRTSGDFIAIFDVDHAPVPAFLDRTLGPFADARIGFVQSAQTFFNAEENLVARAAAEATYEYFNIAAVCKDRLGAACLHGTNAVVRRRALESIGGYLPGLAEDLETSIALHAEGWGSRYVREPLGPGMVPLTLHAYWIQQLKWSRGVFEAACNALRTGRFLRLSWGQRLAYLVRLSYYTVGLTVPLAGSTVVCAALSGPHRELEHLVACMLLLSAVMV
ncbi:MAG: cellulose synthase catalytic subunit, partial [Elusimicrobia bacterium]|nr:cellulose synthase catalytic subunit [Elusimicrobiota bacterium]